MKVFISWSGSLSREVAFALREWLPNVLHAVEPFVSSRDIRAGARWQEEIAGELDDTSFGLICATRENQTEPWLNFEAGALAKSVDSSRVIPLAIDLTPAEIANPLGQFQAMRLTKEDLSEVVVSINEFCDPQISDVRLQNALEKWWPDLREELEGIGERRQSDTQSTPTTPARTDRDLLEELLTSVRSLSRSSEKPSSRAISLDEISAHVRPILAQHGVMPWGISKLGSRGLEITLTKPPSTDLVNDLSRAGAELGLPNVHFELMDEAYFEDPEDEDSV